MKYDNRDDSSDLDRARRLSASLRSLARSGKVESRAELGYVRFSARRILGEEASTEESTQGKFFGPEFWNQLLDSCMEGTDASAAFALDNTGLLIALRGNERDDIDALGALLTTVLDRVERIQEHGSRSVAIELEFGWLSGFRAPSPHGEMVTIGTLGKAPLSSSGRTFTTRLLTYTE